MNPQDESVSHSPIAGTEPTPDETRLFELLTGYVDSLHRGDVDSRSALVVNNPQLVNWLRCLELLDRLAPAPAERREATETELTRSGDESGGPPRTFGKYELLDEVGRGGMGVVFRARQMDLDRIVAVKMILASRLASTDDVQRFRAEARAAGRLRHPGIVAIHEAGEVNGQQFFAMDFVEGRSLADALGQGPFEPAAAARCVIAIGRAVQYLHEHHILHRDLKPSNILLTAEGTPVVTDFGLAKALELDTPRTQTGAIVGTLRYMSPEQAKGELGAISTRSDIYSLGAILFELLTGRTVFNEPGPLDTILQVIEQDPPRPSQLNRSVPLPLEWICLKCLEKDSRNRYQSAAELVEDLERFSRGELPQVGPPDLIRSIRRWGRRRPALAAHLGGLLTAALILQVKYMVSGLDLPYHLTVMGTLAAWGLSSILNHWLLERLRLHPFQYVWEACDAGFLTLLLYITLEPPGPLLIGYPLLIVASGLFFRIGLVWFMTAACAASYIVLVLIGREPIVRPQYTLIFLAALVVVGFIVAHQAHRVRTLTRYLNDENR